ncbi:MAG: glycosyltransferase [Chthoniobacter sp.]|nr:glycosyltransferase [Chthoniobacter sp.]
MKICDLTQFYSPVSGGVKRYVSEKVRHIREHTEDDEHILIIPGARDEMITTERARTYTIQSPLISRTSRYRVLLRLEAIERILEIERPDIIECGDPYQVAWKAVHSGAALGIPVVGFYHSHFPEAYIRTVQKYCGRAVTEFFHDVSRRYIRSLYRRFARTLVPSPALGALLAGWGVPNIAHTDLGVDTAVFHSAPAPGENVRAELGTPADRTLLLYVGRLAQEKNTHTLFAAFRELAHDFPGRFHLLVIGDGLQRAELEQLVLHHPSSVTHLPYCADATRLAACYRAADLFVHPGVQETFGLVTLEAQACGTPVIGIHGSYMDRIIHSDQTLWARENSATALAAAVEETSRADLKASNVRVSRLVAAQYSWTEVFTRLFALYHEVICEHQTAA